MTVIDMIAEEDMINILMIEIDIVVDHLMIMIILLIMEGKKKKTFTESNQFFILKCIYKFYWIRYHDRPHHYAPYARDRSPRRHM